MASKKIVFVIVEGPSDDEALELFIQRIYNNSAHVHIVYGDITTDRFTNPSNIVRRIHDMVGKYAKDSHLNLRTHFQQIVHILDMDGAYIPDNAIVYDASKQEAFYSTKCIRVANVQGIIERNKKKRACLDRLSITSSIGGIPYQAYYMSCNLDHVLHDKLNSSDSEKERDSILFARQYKDNLSGFISFISDSSFSVCGEYIKSWNFIKQNLHSLGRHTNFGICIQRALESADDQVY